MSQQLQNQPHDRRSGSIRHVLGWPLRHLMRLALDHPVILETGTRVASKIPFLYNALLRYAQHNGIVMAAEVSTADPYEISHPEDLTEAGMQIYRQLKQAVDRREEAEP